MAKKSITTAGLFRFIAICVVTFFVLGCSWMLYNSIKEARIIRESNIVEAELVDYTIYRLNTSGRHEWEMIYYYKDKNGIEYRGNTLSFTATEEYVKGKMGGYIYIYIDSKGNSVIWSAWKMPPWLAGLILLAFMALDGYLIFYKKIRKKRNKHE